MATLRDQLQTSLGDAYAIERELGGGGMSHVFVAEEKSLGRRVVVKVLPVELAGSVSIARFRREISLAARLQHPHIVPLLSAGEIDGLPYYTMPFVEGESLRLRLSHGELPIAEAVSLLRDVAKALAFAHGKGIAHRDIKPDNILLAGTSAVITDFGVAKALSDAAVGGGLTSIGVALGTPAYMAPEQAAADPATDVRADIYAFGATAYEMLAGHAPFAGRSVQAMLAAHATEVPPSIARLRPATPAALADLVMRCLEKRPGDRPQSVDEIARALDAIATGSTSGANPSPSTPRVARGRTVVVVGVVAAVVLCIVAGLWWRTRNGTSSGSAIRSIAVLPFENTSGDTAYDYLEDGITDHVRDALNAIPELTVKARSSSRAVKGLDARAIGAKLGVGVVVQGTVSRSSSRLHVTAELVRASDNAALWSSTFDRQPNELAGIQDTIARAIAGKLHLSGVGAPPARLTANRTRGTDDVDAYYSFLQGHYAFDRLDFIRAAELFRQATERDPRFARAHAYLAMSYANVPSLGLASLDSSNALARASAAKALAIDSTVAEAYVAQALILAGEMRLADVVQPMERAMQLDPNNADIVTAYGAALGQIGRVAEGLVQARRARDMDPLSGTPVGLLSYAFEIVGQYPEAITTVKAALDIDPKNAIMYRGLGFYYAFNGQPDSAVASFERAVKLDPQLFGGRSNLVFGYAAAGRWKDAGEQRVLIDREPTGNSPNYYHLLVHLAYGEYDAAMTSLEHSVAQREALFGGISIPCDPLFDPLRSNPRFAALVHKIGAQACAPTGKWPIASRR